ncbi:Xaa-Pro aminopeptidase P [Candidatus Photodesmus blepharus]|uniref:Xaa-Pro aminopeptidase P n=1 Tax=Candidatus Photodesmus blepharonis TaxID=1179155 RepID=A0A084CNS9_9GAMM|nr:aminopeptidase P family protein [Candidatus Photodesmus blepharus]KEY91458.1 Xaa-Pro aminopeptidase P [Candidatus Photodesmus blepharus]
MLNSISDRVNAMRIWLKNHNYGAIIVPHEDEYLNEYLPTHNERLRWLTNFSGSAGMAVITNNKAAIFLDGRYVVQAHHEVPSEIFECYHVAEQSALNWILKNVTHTSKVTIDPHMHNSSWLDYAQITLASTHNLTILKYNPIDKIWYDRPSATISDIQLMSIQSVGKSCLKKRDEIADLIKKMGADSAIITALDSICWLLNIRALDIPRLPVLLSHVILHNNSNVEFFLNSKRLPKKFREHVGPGVTVYAPGLIQQRLETLSGKHILVDPKTSNAWFTIVLKKSNASIVKSSDPCLIPKAIKNKAEIAGIKTCHIRDGIAMIHFLAWLDAEISIGNLHDEALLANKLDSIRKQDPTFKDLSFDTISAVGRNAAMCHYNYKTQSKPSQLTNNTMYLIDSGGQYLYGTTDITRTVAVGKPSKTMIKQFTLVLKGHIGIAQAKFPKGTYGYQIDILARQHLWSEGYDYEHGTGHGVGHFLNVHEGPQHISKNRSSVPLMKNMVVSNEPGYYCNSFGIRIENLELVVELPTKGDFPVLAFETLTLCPIDKRNINLKMLTSSELYWLNNYHKKVWKKINPFVKDDVKQWLKQATEPLKTTEN